MLIRTVARYNIKFLIFLQFVEVALLNIWRIISIARFVKYRFTKVGRC